MFEGSLVESRDLAVSDTQRRSTISSIVLQCSLAALLILIPLFRPQSIPFVTTAPKFVLPISRPRPPTPVARPQPASSTSPATTAPAAAPPPAVPPAARIILPAAAGQLTGPPATLPDLRMGSAGPGAAFGLGAMPTQPAVSVAPSRPPGKVILASTVSAEMLLTPIQLKYPQKAKAAGVQGTVVLEAVISKQGTIESLHAVSGPPMLRQAALDATSAARYRPYMLDGEPTEVQTTITLVFRLSR